MAKSRGQGAGSILNGSPPGGVGGVLLRIKGAYYLSVLTAIESVLFEPFKQKLV